MVHSVKFRREMADRELVEFGVSQTDRARKFFIVFLSIVGPISVLKYGFLEVSHDMAYKAVIIFGTMVLPIGAAIGVLTGQVDRLRRKVSVQAYDNFFNYGFILPTALSIMLSWLFTQNQPYCFAFQTLLPYCELRYGTSSPFLGTAWDWLRAELGQSLIWEAILFLTQWRFSVRMFVLIMISCTIPAYVVVDQASWADTPFKSPLVVIIPRWIISFLLVKTRTRNIRRDFLIRQYSQRQNINPVQDCACSDSRTFSEVGHFVVQSRLLDASFEEISSEKKSELETALTEAIISRFFGGRAEDASTLSVTLRSGSVVAGMSGITSIENMNLALVNSGHNAMDELVAISWGIMNTVPSRGLFEVDLLVDYNRGTHLNTFYFVDGRPCSWLQFSIANFAMHTKRFFHKHSLWNKDCFQNEDFIRYGIENTEFNRCLHLAMLCFLLPFSFGTLFEVDNNTVAFNLALFTFFAIPVVRIFLSLTGQIERIKGVISPQTFEMAMKTDLLINILVMLLLVFHGKGMCEDVSTKWPWCRVNSIGHYVALEGLHTLAEAAMVYSAEFRFTFSALIPRSFRTVAAALIQLRPVIPLSAILLVAIVRMVTLGVAMKAGERKTLSNFAEYKRHLEESQSQRKLEETSDKKTL